MFTYVRFSPAVQWNDFIVALEFRTELSWHWSQDSPKNPHPSLHSEMRYRDKMLFCQIRGKCLKFLCQAFGGVYINYLFVLLRIFAIRFRLDFTNWRCFLEQDINIVLLWSTQSLVSCVCLSAQRYCISTSITFMLSLLFWLCLGQVLPIPWDQPAVSYMTWKLIDRD